MVARDARFAVYSFAAYSLALRVLRHSDSPGRTNWTTAPDPISIQRGHLLL